jgi:GNAT superfamily N-acetyltransferase
VPSPDRSAIRLAIPNDIFHLIDMGAACHREAGIAERDAGLAFDEDSFAYTAGMLMDAGLLLVMEAEGRAVGMAALDGAPCWFNRKTMMGREQFWYVTPAHRGHGRGLLTALEDTARARGMHLLTWWQKMRAFAARYSAGSIREPDTRMPNKFFARGCRCLSAV